MHILSGLVLEISNNYCEHTSKSRLISDFLFEETMGYIRFRNQTPSHLLAEFLLDEYRQINLLNNNTTVVHEKPKSGAICWEKTWAV